MGTRHLEAFFKPTSIVVIGASEKQMSMGGLVLSNLIYAGFEGELYSVNLKNYPQVYGKPSFRKISALPNTPDLAIICTAPNTLSRIIRQLGRLGVKAALILTGGISRSQSRRFPFIKPSLLEVSREAGVRLLGPDCLGIIVPGLQLNASYSHIDVLPGNMAFVGQSGIIGAAVMDWAHGRNVGFSHFITLGEGVDVDIADIINFLALDRQVKSILLHIEKVPEAKKFMTAIRAASRNKLVLAIKSGRYVESQQPADPLPKGLRDIDRIVDVALRRAGVLRVANTDDLFDTVETLSRMKPITGARLAILCNGVGPTIVAADALLEYGGQLAELSVGTRNRLAQVLPDHWQKRNPIDLDNGAPAQQYVDVLKTLAKDDQVDAILAIHVPTLRAPSIDVARAVIKVAKQVPLNILTCWMGETTAEPARKLFDRAGILSYETPEQAAHALMYMASHQRNQEALRETPASIFPHIPDDRLQARRLIESAQREQRDYLLPAEVNQLLIHYGIQTQETLFTDTPDKLPGIAQQLSFPLALRIVHQQYCYPFAYGHDPRFRWRGVVVGIKNAEQLTNSAELLLTNVAQQYPQSKVIGFGLQSMLTGTNSLQFSLGITRDSRFGQVILFGGGGSAVNIIADRQVELPPLNFSIARRLIERSQIHALLKERSQDFKFDLDLLCKTLVTISQISVDCPEIYALESNFVSESGQRLVCLGAAMQLGSKGHLAINPYPTELVEQVELKNGWPVEIRPIRGEDEPVLARFHKELSMETIRYRFFSARTDFSHREMALQSQIDYEREMAFIAMYKENDRTEKMLGIVNCWTDADRLKSEFAVVIQDNLRGTGLGKRLMQKLLKYAKETGVAEMTGTVLPQNDAMLGLAKHLGFREWHNAAEQVVELHMVLNADKYSIELQGS